MDAAAKHGKAGRANDAFTNAERARALLERLMSEPEPFPEAAMGKAPQFDIPRPDVNANIEQMLKALLGQNPGEGNGQAPRRTRQRRHRRIRSRVPAASRWTCRSSARTACSSIRSPASPQPARAATAKPERSSRCRKPPRPARIKPTETRHGGTSSFHPNPSPNPTAKRSNGTSLPETANAIHAMKIPILYLSVHPHPAAVRQGGRRRVRQPHLRRHPHLASVSATSF